MINFVMAGIDLSEYVASYQVSISDVSGGNSFTDVNGNVNGNVLGVKRVIKVSLTKLGGTFAGQVMAALNGGNIAVTAAFPEDFAASGYARDGDINLSSYWVDKAEASGEEEWKIDFSISKTVTGSGDGTSDGL